MFHLIFCISSILFLTTEVVETRNVVEKRQEETAEDAAFKQFLWHTMNNYSDWLSLHDPIPKIADEITLQSDKEQVDEGVNATLEITNQYMRGHSNFARSAIAVNSELDEQDFMVTRDVPYNDFVEFCGDYTTNGTRKLNDQNACFLGSGKWSLKMKNSFENLQILNFVLNQEGYIDMAQTIENDYVYDYHVTWLEIEFEGVEIIDCQENENGGDNNLAMIQEEVNIIKSALAKLYLNFLKSSPGGFSSQVIPPRRLLFNYLTDVLSKNKLSDIIADWTGSSTTDGSNTGSTSSTTTDGSNPGSSSTDNNTSGSETFRSTMSMSLFSFVTLLFIIKM